MRAVDRRDGLVIEIACQPYAVNAGADIAAQFHHVEEFSHEFISAGDWRGVNRLADRDPNSARCDGKIVKTINAARS